MIAGRTLLAALVVLATLAVAPPETAARATAAVTESTVALPWPDRRFAACGAMDPSARRLLAFGGRSEGGTEHHDDAWALELGADGRALPSWRLVAPASAPQAPPPTRSCAAAYDADADRLLVFGGWDGVTMRNGVWALDLGAEGGGWTELCDATSCGTAPSPRRSSQASYDPVRRRLVVVGGLDGAYRNDVWSLALDGQPTWEQLTPSGPTPTPRAAHGQAYDAARDRLWIVGGTTSGRDLDDTCVLDLATTTWQPVVAEGCAPGCPSARSGHALVHDTTADMLVLYGGTGGGPTPFPLDAWALGDLDGGRAWQRLDVDSGVPQPRSFPVSGYDPAGQRLVVFGGGTGVNAFKDAMALHLPVGGPPAWRGIAPRTELTPRDQVAVHYEAATGDLYAFGGFGSGTFPGAVDAGTHLSDTWAQSAPLAPGSGDRWRNATPLDPRTIPLAREGAAVASDTAGHRAFVLGGLNGDVTVADAWIASFTDGQVTWTQLCGPVSCGAGPEPRWGAYWLYDPVDRRVVVFGGHADDGTTFDDTWALELEPAPHWVELAPAGERPASRWSGAVAYDPAHRRMVIWGGQSGPDATATAYNDTWALALDGAPEWTELHPTGERRRSGAAPPSPAGPGPDGVVRKRPTSSSPPASRRPRAPITTTCGVSASTPSTARGNSSPRTPARLPTPPPAVVRPAPSGTSEPSSCSFCSVATSPASWSTRSPSIPTPADGQYPRDRSWEWALTQARRGRRGAADGS